MIPKTFTTILFLTACSNVYAGSLRQWDSPDVASFVAYASELAFNKGHGGLDVRIHTFPLVLGECWGKIDSCPDIELSVSVSAGELYEKPALLRFPSSKGWEFVRWLGDENVGGEKSRIGFVLCTTIPEANIEESERAQFKSNCFNVWVSESGGNYESTRR